MVLMLEIGRVDRFPTAAHLASYAGLVPRVHSSGGHTRMGQVCGNVNRNLKWAFVETGNLIVINQRGLAGTHVVRLYQRIKRSKNHQKAVVAVARLTGRDFPHQDIWLPSLDTFRTYAAQMAL